MAYGTFNFSHDKKEPLGTIYVVDDDAEVRNSFTRVLEVGNYRVQAFDSGESFLAKFDPNAIAVLIIDQRMDGSWCRLFGFARQDDLFVHDA